MADVPRPISRFHLSTLIVVVMILSLYLGANLYIWRENAAPGIVMTSVARYYYTYSLGVPASWRTCRKVAGSQIHLEGGGVLGSPVPETDPDPPTLKEMLFKNSKLERETSTLGVIINIVCAMACALLIGAFLEWEIRRISDR